MNISIRSNDVNATTPPKKRKHVTIVTPHSDRSQDEDCNSITVSLSNSLEIEEGNRMCSSGFESPDSALDFLIRDLSQFTSHWEKTLKVMWEYLIREYKKRSELQKRRIELEKLCEEQKPKTRSRSLHQRGEVKSNQKRSHSSSSLVRTSVNSRSILKAIDEKELVQQQLYKLERDLEAKCSGLVPKEDCIESADFIMMRGTTPAFLARVFISILRYNTVIRREKQRIVEKRFVYNRKLRAFSGWRNYILSIKRRHQFLCTCVVEQWLAYVKVRKSIHIGIENYLTSLRQRLEAFKKVKAIQQKRILELMKTVSKQNRIARLMSGIKLEKRSSSTGSVILKPTPVVSLLKDIISDSSSDSEIEVQESKSMSEEVKRETSGKIKLFPLKTLSEINVNKSFHQVIAKLDETEKKSNCFSETSKLKSIKHGNTIGRIVLNHWFNRMQKRRQLREAEEVEKRRMLENSIRVWKEKHESVISDVNTSCSITNVEVDQTISASNEAFHIRVAIKFSKLSLLCRTWNLMRYRANIKCANRFYIWSIKMKAIKTWIAKTHRIMFSKYVKRTVLMYWHQCVERSSRLRFAARWHLSKAAFNTLHSMKEKAKHLRYRKTLLTRYVLKRWSFQLRVLHASKFFNSRKTHRNLIAWRSYVYQKRKRITDMCLAVVLDERALLFKVLCLWHSKYKSSVIDRAAMQLQSELYAKKVITRAFQYWLHRYRVRKEKVKEAMRIYLQTKLNESSLSNVSLPFID